MTTKYTAVSYSWGDALHTREISINKKTFHVRENLYQFLLAVEDDHETRFWIDQICIDQSNINERNHQVNFMSQIYNWASQVIIWSGPRRQNSDIAMEFLSLRRNPVKNLRDEMFFTGSWGLTEENVEPHVRCVEEMENILKEEEKTLESLRSRVISLGSSSLLSREAGDIMRIAERMRGSVERVSEYWKSSQRRDQPLDEDLFKKAKIRILSVEKQRKSTVWHITREALKALFQRPYWKRVWILQEIMLARSLTIHCGQHTTSWNNLERFFRIPRLVRSRRGSAFRAGFEYEEADNARVIMNEKDAFMNSASKLSYYITEFSGWLCEEPRDKIYGFLSLIAKAKRVNIDYGKPILEICTDVIRKGIQVEDFAGMDENLEFGRALLEIMHCEHEGLEEIVMSEFRRYEDMKRVSKQSMPRTRIVQGIIIFAPSDSAMYSLRRILNAHEEV